MAFRSRRLLCLLTALLFAISSVGHVYAVTNAVMKMPAAAMDGTMPDHGMDCGGSMPVAVALHAIEPAVELPPPEREPLPEPHPLRT